MVHERDQPFCGLQAPSGEILPASSSSEGVNAHDYYGEYHGHTIRDLELVHQALRRDTSGASRSIVFLCGDSTLDNKYWLPGFATKPASGGYERVLSPPVMQEDVAYWMNQQLQERGLGADAACLNCSVEESTLGDRKGGNLLPQDVFIRDHLGTNDVLVVSCGGNDIALRPSASTILSVAGLLLSPRSLIKSGWAPGMRHMVQLFGDQTRDFVSNLCSKCPDGGPRCVVVCMLYFLDEAATPSWAARTLSALGYDRDPTKLQLLIRTVYELATKHIDIPGLTVVPVPLFEALDGKTSTDYVQRVEPSSRGGRKMARAIVDRIADVVWPARKRE